MTAEQYNGASAQIGSGYNATWASGDNFTGSSIFANYGGKGNLETSEGCETYFNENHPPYGGDSWDYDGKIKASLTGNLSADGTTVANASREHNDNNASSYATGKTLGDSNASANTAFSSMNGNSSEYDFDATLHAFGTWEIKHQSYAALPDNTATAITYGAAKFDYNNTQYVEGNNNCYGGMDIGIKGDGFAKTIGNSDIDRTANAFNVTSKSISRAYSNMPVGYSNSCCEE